MSEASVPWKKDSASVRGGKTEKIAAKLAGGRIHARSGAGVEKDDFSTDEAVTEFKNPAKSHTINGAKLGAQISRALQQGKTPRYVIYFEDYDITLVGELKRGLAVE